MLEKLMFWSYILTISICKKQINLIQENDDNKVKY